MTDDVKLDEADVAAARLKARKSRNVWLAWALVGFVVIVGATTAIRIQSSFADECTRLYFTGSMSDAAAEEKCRQDKVGPYRNDVEG